MYFLKNDQRNWTVVIDCLVFGIQFSWNHQSISLRSESGAYFLNSTSYFQSICYSTYAEMTRFISHVMSSHMECKCVFIWVLNWYLFCCSRTDITTCTEIGILENSDEPISIWVSLGQIEHLWGILFVQKVKMKLEGPTTRCKTQTSPCVFSSY